MYSTYYLGICSQHFCKSIKPCALSAPSQHHVSSKAPSEDLLLLQMAQEFAGLHLWVQRYAALTASTADPVAHAADISACNGQHCTCTDSQQHQARGLYDHSDVQMRAAAHDPRCCAKGVSAEQAARPWAAVPLARGQQHVVHSQAGCHLHVLLGQGRQGDALLQLQGTRKPGCVHKQAAPTRAQRQLGSGAPSFWSGWHAAVISCWCAPGWLCPVGLALCFSEGLAAYSSIAHPVASSPALCRTACNMAPPQAASLLTCMGCCNETSPLAIGSAACLPGASGL